QPNMQYTLSGVARARLVANATAKLFAYEYDSQGQWLGSTRQAAIVGGDERYRPIQVQFITRPQTARLQVRFEIFGTDAEGEAWIDDVYLGHDVEEPQPVSEVL